MTNLKLGSFCCMHLNADSPTSWDTSTPVVEVAGGTIVEVRMREKKTMCFFIC